METFERDVDAVSVSGMVGLGHALEAARVTTGFKYAEIWNDATKMELAISCLLLSGTDYILNGFYDAARNEATTASYFEEWVAVA